jgi:hypothetical protein
MIHFQCPECGFGDYEVGHLVAEDEVYCIVCLEEERRRIRVRRRGPSPIRGLSASPSCQSSIDWYERLRRRAAAVVNPAERTARRDRA